MKNRQKTIIAVVIGFCVLLTGITVYQLTGGFSGRTSVPVKISLGGPFNLKDHNGKPVTEKTFYGKYMLIYFGYTFCPDVCPTELQKMTTALEMIGDTAKKITPVFVSVDPERDDKPGVMKDYVENFYPGMIGLTGTTEQIAAVTKLYRVYFKKVTEKGAAPDEYSVDHSSIIYLMAPDGSFVKFFSNATTPADMAKSLKEIIGK